MTRDSRMRTPVHVGLAALLVIAPTLCCCNFQFLSGRANAATHVPFYPACSQNTLTSSVGQSASCCHLMAAPAPKPCCESNATNDTPESKPNPQSPKHCPACDRPDSALPQDSPEVASLEATGELLPVAFLHQTAIPFEHFGLIGGLDPPEGAGVDMLYEVLFARHVMRC